MANVRRSRVFAAASNWPIINGSLIDNRTLFTPTAKFVIRTSKQILLLLQFLKIWPVFDTKLQWELTLLFAKNRMIRTCALIGSLCYLSTTTPLVSLELYRKNPLQLRPFWEAKSIASTTQIHYVPQNKHCLKMYLCPCRLPLTDFWMPKYVLYTWRKNAV